MAIGIRSQATFGLADLHTALHRRICDTQGCDTDTAQYINMKTFTRLCHNCFAEHAWYAKHVVSLALIYSRYAEENSKPREEIAGLLKVPVTEQMVFVYMGPL